MASGYNQYSGYGGNPYEQQQGGSGGGGGGGYGQSNPYGGDGGGNPYSGGAGYGEPPVPAQRQYSNYSHATQDSQYDEAPPAPAQHAQQQNAYAQGAAVPGQNAQQQDAYAQGASAPGQHTQQQNTYAQGAAVPGQNAPQQNTYAQGAAVPGQNAPQQNTYAQGAAVPGQNAPQQNAYAQGPTVLSNQDFLSRVEAAKADIRTLTAHVGEIASQHQRTLSSSSAGSSAALEALVTQTQVLNTRIKDQIKFLETDAARSRGNPVKDTQIGQLKNSFTKQLQEYRQEEASYEKRYREQIARQYRIVNPEADEAEVHEAANADWGNEGVFQTALKTNRSATANTVLGAVRARHNDIQKIERTMLALQLLMEELATAVVLQEEPVQQTEQQTDNVKHDTEAGNVQLDKGIGSARRARKLKWWCFFICLAIIVILALVLGLYFGLEPKGTK